MGNQDNFLGRKPVVIGYRMPGDRRAGPGFRSAGHDAGGVGRARRGGPEKQGSDEWGSERGEPVRCPGDAHEIVIGPTGSGKTVGRIIPLILEHDGPVVALDVKGELYRRTALSRAIRGHDIYLIDPFGVVDDMKTSRLDPGQSIMRSHDPSDQALILAEALNPGSMLSREPFWDHSANRLNAAGLHYAALNNSRLSEGAVTAWHDMLNGPNFVRSVAEALDDNPDLPESIHQAFGSFLQTPEVTRGCIATTAQTAMRLFAQSAVRRVIGPSDIDLTRLADRSDYAIYIALPPKAVAAYGPLLRLWFEMILKALMERAEIPETPALVVVDEAGAVGRIPSLETAYSMGRGYGIRAVTAVQTMHQLEQAYPDAHRVLTDNAGLISVLQPPHFLAATEVAQLIGTFSPEALMATGPGRFVASMWGREPEILIARSWLSDPDLQKLAGGPTRRDRPRR